MIDRLQPSPFLAAQAVTVWDTWFRWRENGRLRDISVEQTWARVAVALSAAEPGSAARRVTRCFDAQSRWQLILDERILAGAGTQGFVFPQDPVAMVNAAVFVDAPFSATARFDFDALRNAAALAVRCLDNALLLIPHGQEAPADLRVGLLGVADALALLGKRYDSPAGRVTAAKIAHALAEGCLHGSVQLAQERGASDGAGADSLPEWRLREFTPELLADLKRHGLRHRQLTEISSQSRLARFANNVADALDPIRSDQATHPAAAKAVGGVAAPYAVTLARAVSAEAASGLGALLPAVSLPAQIKLRGAVQPWIDAPIRYPFRVADVAGEQATAMWQKWASAHKLGALTLAQL